MSTRAIAGSSNAIFASVTLLLLSSTLFSQEQKGQFSGSFDTNVNFFIEDEKIGASNTPQYDDNLVGIEAWLNLKYQRGTFSAGIRLDAFQNSSLLNPTDAYSEYGVGRVYVSKEWNHLELTAGYIYDQIGSGIIFKAYEERALLLDNALLGLRARYYINDNWNLSAFGGKQKNLFDVYDSWLYGGRIEGYVAPKNPEATWSCAPGAGLVFKTLSEDQMDLLANVLSTYTPDDFIDEVPYSNVAVTLYNTLQTGPLSWYIEGAYKSREAFYDLNASRSLWTGGESVGKFVLEPGFVVYSALSYADKGFGASLELKATSNFNFRADPFAPLNRGLIHFLPPMMRLHTYRLPARYATATQDLGELAGQFELSYRASTTKNYLVNFSHITDLDGELLYREFLAEATFKKPRKSTLITGLQLQWYDQELYQGKTAAPMVRAVTPYLDYLNRIGKKQSIRCELQFMHTKQDFGSWIFGLVEVGVAPHWIFEVSDMWNVIPYEDSAGQKKNDPLHYPSVGVTYSTGAHRFSGKFVKQVEGIVCSGGICRLEPAFSGVRLQVSSQF
jgi:hypothetical protein